MIELRGEDWIYRVLGIDNGSNTVGYTVTDHDLRTNVSTVVYAWTLTADRTAYERYGLVESRSKLDARLKLIYDVTFEVCDEYDPHIVGSESPFLHLHAQSFGVLLMSQNAIDNAVYAYNPSIEFAKVPPGKAKKAVCPPGKYNSDKEMIRHHILTNPQIVEGPGVIFNRLDEHCMDGIAVGRCLALDAARAFT